MASSLTTRLLNTPVVEAFRRSDLGLRVEYLLRKTNLEVEDLIFIDSLTKAYNRRFFDQELLRLTAPDRRQNIDHEKASRRTPLQDPFVLVLADIDYFKLVNDQKGHLTGDQVLRDVVTVLTQKGRKTKERVFRYGGEEIAILAEDLQDPRAYMERLRTGIEDYFQKKYQDDLLIATPEGTRGLTMSFGASSFPNDTVCMDLLLQYADLALYHSKFTGRNRSTLFSKDLR